MRRIFVVCALLSALLFLIDPGFAKIPVPGRTDSWVNDYAGIIDKNTKEYLENFISSIGQKTPDPVEIIIATFKSLEGWDLEDFAAEYGEKWRLTKRGRDNGVVILVALEDRRVFIGIGRNLKDILTDVVTYDIVQSVIVPEFSEGRYSEGIKKAAETIVKILSEAEIPAGNPLIIMRNILIASLIIFAFFLTRRFSQRRKRHLV